MIYDSIDNLIKYKGSIPEIELIADYLLKRDLNKLMPGSYPIQGDRLYVIISYITTQPKEELLWESHYKYADLQYVFSGKEVYGSSNVERFHNSIKIDKEKDILFYDKDPDSGAWITVKASEFVYFGLQDAHKSCCMEDNPKKVKKAIFKILL